MCRFATMDLAGMGRHTFKTKVKDSCIRCRGVGVQMGIVCHVCHGSGLDEVGLVQVENAVDP
jgi:DnaJ-class molecular chaperone